MSDPVEVTQKSRRVAWNKGKLVGPKPPLKPKHVWSIRTTLQLEGRMRDLAMFNLAIDSKLRGCDVVALKVEDVAPHGYSADRVTVRPEEDRPTCSLRADRANASRNRRLFGSRFDPAHGVTPFKQFFCGA
jgi:hypothetical protein